MQDIQKNNPQNNQKSQQKDDSGQNQNIENLQKELDQMTLVCKRALADLDNYKKSAVQDYKKIQEATEAKILKEFLGILDSFERSRKFFETLPEEHQKGLKAIYDQTKAVFDKFHVKEIPAIGQKLDMRLHEPLLQAPGEAGKILDELEKGYIIYDSTVLRPTKVKIGDGTNS